MTQSARGAGNRIPPATATSSGGTANGSPATCIAARARARRSIRTGSGPSGRDRIRDARIARYGLVLTVATFLLQSVFVTAEVVGLGFVEIPVIITSIVVAAVVAAATALFGYRGMKRADRDGGRASAVGALTVAVVLGATPLSFLMAYALMGFQIY